MVNVIPSRPTTSIGSWIGGIGGGGVGADNVMTALAILVGSEDSVAITLICCPSAAVLGGV
jgi:hypothetical protein